MMSRSLIAAFLCAMLLSTPAYAQEYSKIRIAIGGGYGSTFGESNKGGLLVFAEPAFRISDKILIGVRFERVSLQRGLSRNIAINNPKTFVTSVGAFSQLYFGRKYVRAFVGFGAGYVIKSNEIIDVIFAGNTNTFQIGEETISFLFRAGIEWGHVTACVDYNFMGDEIVSPFLEIKNSYPAIRIGFLFGGGIH